MWTCSHPSPCHPIRPRSMWSPRCSIQPWSRLDSHYVLRRAHGEDDAIETVRDLRDVIDVRLPDEHLVLDAARLKADHPMAYAEAFGAALAILEDATLWTGDPELLVDGSPWRWQDLRRTS